MGIGGELKNGDQMATPRQSLAAICACPICMDIFKDARQLSCCNNHLCGECLNRSTQQGVLPTCPMCRARNPRSEPAAPSMRKHLRKCRMLCIYSTCPENENGIIIDDYESHIAQCPHLPVRCEFCDKEFSQRLISAHQENECTQKWKKTAQSGRNMAEENSRLGTEVYHLQMQLNEAEQRYTREIQQAKYDNESLRSVNENLKREIEFKDSQISQLKERLEQTKQSRKQHDDLHESMRSLQDQMRQMQHGEIPRQGYPARPPQMSGPPQQAYNASEEDDIDIYYSANGDSSSDQVFVSRRSTSSVNSSFVVPSEKYEKTNPFQTDQRSSASLSSFDEQQQPSTSYFNQGINQGMPARPAPMSANLSVAPKSKGPKPKPFFKKK